MVRAALPHMSDVSAIVTKYGVDGAPPISKAMLESRSQAPGPARWAVLRPVWNPVPCRG